MKRWIRSALGPLLGLLLFGLALWTLHHELERYHYHEIARDLAAIPSGQLLLSLAFTAAGYLMLTGYDLLALRFARHPLPYRRISLASFISYAISHNFGFSMISGISVRYRLYSAWGLSDLQILRVVAFCAAAFWIGLLGIGSVVFLFEQPPIPSFLPMSPVFLRGVGGALLVVLAACAVLVTISKGWLRIRGREIALPSPRLSLGAAVVSVGEWLAAGAALYVLLPDEAPLSFPGFMGTYLLAQIAGLVSQVPG